jgi:hypothetical protein
MIKEKYKDSGRGDKREASPPEKAATGGRWKGVERPDPVTIRSGMRRRLIPDRISSRIH